jgi:hypothetical protein
VFRCNHRFWLGTESASIIIAPCMITLYDDHVPSACAIALVVVSLNLP